VLEQVARTRAGGRLDHPAHGRLELAGDQRRGVRTDDQIAAFYRRCARAIAAKGVPLGTMPGSDEFGPQRLASFDAEIERYEGPTRRFVFG